MVRVQLNYMNEYLPHYGAAVAYLSRDPHANRELLLALRYEHVAALHLAWRGNTVGGVLVRGSGPFNPDPHWVRLDADDQVAMHELLQQITIDQRLVVSLHRPWMDAPALEYGLRATGAGVHGYIAGRGSLRLAPDLNARLLTSDDWSLVERSACGWSRGYFERLFEDGRRPWVLIADGQIVSRASSGYAIADCEEVVGVWTHPRWRGRGLARRLVATVATDILRHVPYVAYTTTFDNQASQSVANAVGFQNCFTATSYQRR